jgi:ribosomal protein S6--L-glutamate ligase
MKTILVVNGESYWQDYLPGYDVQQKKIQSTDWIIKEGQLFAIDGRGAVKPDGILWRVGAIKPSPKHRAALELIKMAGVPCVNSAEVLLRGFDRLSMLGVMKECGLPTIPFNVATDANQLKNIELPFEFVVKVGNYHGGFGKVLVQDYKRLQDIKDLLFITEDYVTVEPYIKYERDLRYLAIGDGVWAMSRRGKYWKANVETTDYSLEELDDELVAQTKKLQAFLGADIVAIDILEEKSGTRHFVEYNDIPGLSGFPEILRNELAEGLMRKVG